MQLLYYSYLLSKIKMKSIKSKIPDSSSFEFIRFPENSRVQVSFTKDDISKAEARIEKIMKDLKENKFQPKINSMCFFCDYKRLLCPLYK